MLSKLLALLARQSIFALLAAERAPQEAQLVLLWPSPGQSARVSLLNAEVMAGARRKCGLQRGSWQSLHLAAGFEDQHALHDQRLHHVAWLELALEQALRQR